MLQETRQSLLALKKKKKKKKLKMALALNNWSLQ